MKAYEYNTFHFRPVRKWNQGELDMTLKQIGKYLSSDVKNRKFFTRYDGGFYRYADFYAAMENSSADIFCCEETGKNYVPCNAELFIYNEKAR